VNTGLILDEDIQLTIAAATNPATIPMFYRDGASAWRKGTNSGYAFLVGGGSTLPLYNYDSGGWTTAEITNNYYVLMHLFATNDPDMPFITVMGQDDYATNTQARAAASVEMTSLVLAGMPFTEFVAVATFIMQGSTGYANAMNTRFISTEDGGDFVDWRYSEITSGGGSSAGDHDNLTNRDATNQHPSASIYNDTTNFDGALSAADTTVQEALDTLDNSISDFGHAHYELDLTLSGSNVWTVTSGTVASLSTDDMDVYLNGLLNRDHTDYFTALVEGSKLTVTFAYNTYESDWAHVKFWKDQA